MVILTKVNIKMEDLMDLEIIDGLMQLLYIKVHLKMVSDMVKENGLKIKLNILEIMSKD